MEENAKASITDDQLLRIDDVAALTTLSKSCINLWVAQGKFIKPTSLSPTVKVWQMGALRAWVAERIQPKEATHEYQTAQPRRALTLYSHRYKTTQGKSAQQKITFNANNPVRYYKPYSYFGIYCGTVKEPIAYSWRVSQEPHTEWLLRARRCVAFADAAELRPVKFNVKKHNDVWEEVRAACNLDHTTIWLSNYGTLFLLTEPYCNLEDKPDTLSKAGFSYIEIPLNLSPYCGGCDGSLSTANKPWTKSYLITLTAQQAELSDINDRLRLAAQSALPWNDMSGVRNV